MLSTVSRMPTLPSEIIDMILRELSDMLLSQRPMDDFYSLPPGDIARGPPSNHRLDRNATLFRCALVDRRWASLAVPILYGSLYVDWRYNRAVSLLRTLEQKPELYDLVVHVDAWLLPPSIVLIMQDWVRTEPVVPTSFAAELQRREGPWVSAVEGGRKALWTGLIAGCHRLSCLVLRGAPLRAGDLDDPRLSTILASIETLQIDDSVTSYVREDHAILLRQIRIVRKLDIYTPFHSINPFPPTGNRDEMTMSSPNLLPQLRSLTARYSNHNESNFVIGSLSQSITSLTLSWDLLKSNLTTTRSLLLVLCAAFLPENNIKHLAIVGHLDLCREAALALGILLGEALEMSRITRFSLDGPPTPDLINGLPSTITSLCFRIFSTAADRLSCTSTEFLSPESVAAVEDAWQLIAARKRREDRENALPLLTHVKFERDPIIVNCADREPLCRGGGTEKIEWARKRQWMREGTELEKRKEEADRRDRERVEEARELGISLFATRFTIDSTKS